MVEFTIDSGAVYTVIPTWALPKKKIIQTKESKAKQLYLAANNSKIGIHGRKSISGYTDDGSPLKMEAEVADVKRALGSVRRLCESGNKVVFDSKNSYIEQKATGKRTKIEDNGKGYKVTIWVPGFARLEGP